MDNCDNILKKFLDNNYIKDEELDIFRHFSRCQSCSTKLSKEGYDKEDIIVLLSLCADTEKQPGLDDRFKKAKGKIYEKVMQEIEKDKKEEEGRGVDKLKDFFTPIVLKPVFVTVLLLVAVGGYLYINTGDDTYIGIKGYDNGYSKITMSFSLVDYGNDGKLSTGKKGARNSTYSENSKLIFRFDIDKPGYIYLIHTNSKFNVNLVHLVNKQFSQPGIIDLKRNGNIMPYSLEGLTGKQYFISLYSKDKIEDISDQASSITRAIINNEKEKISYDYFEINVE